jgi:hypothetical protein
MAVLQEKIHAILSDIGNQTNDHCASKKNTVKTTRDVTGI